ncbi:MAG: 4Fe-4S binding protein, partial [Planctomycetes bacterium]|nr:4Fe-4S binding protein [Planctomycetota bacterium]
MQLACLAAFAWLVAATATSAAQAYAVPAIAWLPFRLDPLTAAVAIMAGTATLGVLLWGSAALAAGLLFGRAFCGWICPLGTAMDAVRRLASPLLAPLQRRLNQRSGPWLEWLGRLPLALLAALALAT